MENLSISEMKQELVKEDGYTKEYLNTLDCIDIIKLWQNL